MGFKKPGITARLRAAKSRRLKTYERGQMGQARHRDGYCRFPLCSCRQFGLVPEVSHDEHRGMGGNPTGDRTVPEKMVLLCPPRHRASKFSIDTGGMRWEAQTSDGAAGPVTWLMRASLLPGIYYSPYLHVRDDGFFVLAVEVAPHIYEPLSLPQARILNYLAGLLYL